MTLEDDPSAAPPAELVEEILRRVEQGPLSAYGAGQLVGLGKRFRDPGWNDPGRVAIASTIFRTATTNATWPNADLQASAYILLAELEQRRQNRRGMVQALEAGLALKPDRPEARLVLATELHRLNRVEEARRHLARVDPVRLSPEGTAWRKNLQRMLATAEARNEDGAP